MALGRLRFCDGAHPAARLALHYCERPTATLSQCVASCMLELHALNCCTATRECQFEKHCIFLESTKVIVMACRPAQSVLSDFPGCTASTCPVSGGLCCIAQFIGRRGVCGVCRRRPGLTAHRRQGQGCRPSNSFVVSFLHHHAIYCVPVQPQGCPGDRWARQGQCPPAAAASALGTSSELRHSCRRCVGEADGDGGVHGLGHRSCSRRQTL